MIARLSSCPRLCWNYRFFFFLNELIFIYILNTAGLVFFNLASGLSQIRESRRAALPPLVGAKVLGAGGGGGGPVLGGPGGGGPGGGGGGGGGGGAPFPEII